MTRDEIARSASRRWQPPIGGFDRPFYDNEIAAMKRAFDSLHGIARVDPAEPTAEMLRASLNYFSDGLTPRS
jgi:hypothetical protein